MMNADQAAPSRPLRGSHRMEIVVRKTDLQRELSLLQNIVERKITIPVLANVLVEAEGDTMRMMATDLDMSLRTQCTASVSKGGTLTLPAKKLFEIVGALPETEIRITEDKGGKSVTIAADRFESRMQTLPSSEFPTPPDASGLTFVSLPGAELKRMITYTRFAITSEDTRYFLNGALLVLNNTQMSLVATDGHRLAYVTAPREVPKGHKADEVKILLPKKTLNELNRVVGDATVDIELRRGDNHLFFEMGTRQLASRVIDGQFPAYDRVIPKNNDKKIDFERERFARAVKRVALLSSERSRAVKFQIDKGQVDVVSSNPDLGDAKETLLVDYDGPSMQLCFNAQYVSEFLSAVETEQVVLEFRDETSQAVMKPVAPEGYDYLYVIMPMRA